MGLLMGVYRVLIGVYRVLNVGLGIFRGFRVIPLFFEAETGQRRSLIEEVMLPVRWISFNLHAISLGRAIFKDLLLPFWTQ